MTSTSSQISPLHFLPNIFLNRSSIEGHELAPEMATPLAGPRAVYARILPHISQLLLVLDPIPHPMMKRLPLPRPRLFQVTPAKAALPEFHPLIDPETKIARCAKEMQVIGHEQIITH